MCRRDTWGTRLPSYACGREWSPGTLAARRGPQYNRTIRHGHECLTQYNLKTATIENTGNGTNARMFSEIRAIAKAKCGTRSDTRSPAA